MLDGGRRHREATRFHQPPPEHEDRPQRDDRQREQPPEPEGPVPEAVDDGGQPGPHAVPRGDQRDGLGAVRGPGLLGRAHLGHGIGGAEQGTTQGEDDDEPPVPGTGRRQDGEPEAHGARGHQQGTAPEPVGQGRQGQAAQGGEAEDGETDPELGAREAGLIGDRGPVHDTPEVPGHVAQRRHRPELPEPRGERHERHRHDGRIGPRAQSEGILRSWRGGDPIVLLGYAPPGTDTGVTPTPAGTAPACA